MLTGGDHHDGESLAFRLHRTATLTSSRTAAQIASHFTPGSLLALSRVSRFFRSLVFTKRGVDLGEREEARRLAGLGSRRLDGGSAGKPPRRT